MSRTVVLRIEITPQSPANCTQVMHMLRMGTCAPVHAQTVYSRFEHHFESGSEIFVSSLNAMASGSPPLANLPAQSGHQQRRCLLCNLRSALSPTRLSSRRSSADSHNSVMSRLVPRLTVAVRCMQTVQESGVGAFYRGLQPALLGTVISQGLYFYLYAELRRFVTVRCLKVGHMHSLRTRTARYMIAQQRNLERCIVACPA